MTHTIARVKFTGESPFKIGDCNGKLVYHNGVMKNDVEYIVLLEQLSSGNYKVHHGKEMNVPYDLLDKFQFESLEHVLSEYKKIQSQFKKQVKQSCIKHANT